MNLAPFRLLGGGRAIGLATGAALAQTALNQSNNIAYTLRDGVREQEAAKDRKLDHLLRHFVMSLVTPCVMETSFRTAETLFHMPLTVEHLGLRDLKAQYGPKSPHGYRENAKNYKTLPPLIRKRFVSSLASDSDFPVLAKLLRTKEIPKLSGEAKKEAELLADHLERKFNFTDYVKNTLVKRGQLTTAQAQEVVDGYEEQLKALQENMKTKKISSTDTAKVDELVKGITTELGSHEFKELILDGIQSHRATEMLKRVQRIGFWPKNMVNLAANFVIYGVIVNYLDVKVVQPWQDRVVAKRGTTEDLVAPAYWSMIPGAAALVGMLKLTRRMSYLGQFATSAAVALGTYFGVTIPWIKSRLDKPPKDKGMSAEKSKAPAPQAPAVGFQAQPAVPVNAPGSVSSGARGPFAVTPQLVGASR